MVPDASASGPRRKESPGRHQDHLCRQSWTSFLPDWAQSHMRAQSRGKSERIAEITPSAPTEKQEEIISPVAAKTEPAGSREPPAGGQVNATGGFFGPGKNLTQRGIHKPGPRGRGFRGVQGGPDLAAADQRAQPRRDFAPEMGAPPVTRRACGRPLAVVGRWSTCSSARVSAKKLNDFKGLWLGD